MRHLEGDVPGVAEAEQLLASHRPGSEVGDISDFEMAVAGFVLCAHGEFQRATNLTSHYLEQSRRSRAPLTCMLRDAIAMMEQTALSERRGAGHTN